MSVAPEDGDANFVQPSNRNFRYRKIPLVELKCIWSKLEDNCFYFCAAVSGREGPETTVTAKIIRFAEGGLF